MEAPSRTTTPKRFGFGRVATGVTGVGGASLRVGLKRLRAAMVEYPPGADSAAGGIGASLAAGGRAPHAAARMVAACEKLGPRGRADGADKKPLEESAVFGERVDIRRGEIRVAVNAQVAPALVVGEDDDDIWVGFIFCRIRGKICAMACNPHNSQGGQWSKSV